MAVDEVARVDRGWPVPDMTLRNDACRRAPICPVDLIPNWSDWLSKAAIAAGVPVDYVLAPFIAIVAAVIGNTRKVSPGPGWSEALAVWVAAVGHPGTGKSPAAAAALEALSRLESEIGKGQSEALRSWERDRLEAEATRAQWEADIKAATKAGRPSPPMPIGADIPERPFPPRYRVHDITPEALVRAAYRALRGFLSYQDELAGLIGGFGKYHKAGGGAERAMYLSAYDGTSYGYDRVNDETRLWVERFLLSIAGGIQPDRFARMLGDSATDDDGLSARFLYLWPEWIKPARPTQGPEVTFFFRALRRLHGLDFMTDEDGRTVPRIIQLTADAADVFYEWRERHHDKIEAASGLFRSWIAKRPGTVLRLSAIIEMIEWAAGDGDVAPETVTLQSIERATKLVDDYFIPMAERVFGDAALPENERAAATLAKQIALGRIGNKKAGARLILNARDVRRMKLPGLRRADEVEAAIQVLIDSDWLRPLPPQKSPAGGRPSKDFEINPAVLDAAPARKTSVTLISRNSSR